MKDKVFMVLYDDGREFEYSLFKTLEWAKKERQRIYDTYWFGDLEKWEIEREWEYKINDIYGWAWLNIKEVEINP